jgi:plasmid stabilization system protein ParE
VTRLTVVIAAEVKWQIEDVMAFIANHSIDNALAWEARVIAAMRALGDFHGHAVNEEATERLGLELRKFAFEGTYVIHYRVDEAAGQVRVVALRNGARLPRRGEP